MRGKEKTIIAEPRPKEPAPHQPGKGAQRKGSGLGHPKGKARLLEKKNGGTRVGGKGITTRRPAKSLWTPPGPVREARELSGRIVGSAFDREGERTLDATGSRERRKEPNGRPGNHLH